MPKSKIKYPDGVKDDYAFNQYLHTLKWKAEEDSKQPYASPERKRVGDAAVAKALKEAGVKSDYWEGMR